jgi:hypothetical protein
MLWRGKNNDGQHQRFVGNSWILQISPYGVLTNTMAGEALLLAIFSTHISQKALWQLLEQLVEKAAGYTRVTC